MAMDHTRNLERREFKYLITEALAEQIKNYLQGICVLDPYADEAGGYPIRSLYLDTDEYDLYQANQREDQTRFKARIRSYPQGGQGVWFEIKGRHGDTIQKSRAGVPEGVWQRLLLEPTSFDRAAFKKKDAPMIERFVYHAQAYHLRPKILVEYDRAAYVSTLDDYARVTFDRHIRCQAQNEVSVEAEPSHWRVVDHPRRVGSRFPLCVLELKFGAMIPRWMLRLVQHFEVIRYSFSKYCYSVEALHLLPHSHVAGIQARSF